LFLVVTGGTAQALNGSNTVFSDDIVNREVKNADLGLAAVTANRLAPNSVRTGRVVDESLTGDDVANTSINGAEIDEGAVSLSGDVRGLMSNTSLGPGVVNSVNVGTDTLRGYNIDEATLNGVDADTLNGLSSRARSYHVTDTNTATATHMGALSLRPVCIAQSGEDNVKLFAASAVDNSWITAVAKQDSDSSDTTTADDTTFNQNDQIEIQTPGDGAGYLMFRKGLKGVPASVLYTYNEGPSSCDVMFVGLGDAQP